VNVPEVADHMLPAARSLRLPHAASAVSAARRRVRAELSLLDLPEAVLDDAEVVVSELLGNSVRHARPIAGGVLLLSWRVGDDNLIIRVTDGGGGRGITTRDANPLSDSGRGLHIVERLSLEWGVTEHAGGLRSVWAVLPTLGRPRPLRLVT